MHHPLIFGIFILFGSYTRSHSSAKVVYGTVVTPEQGTRMAHLHFSRLIQPTQEIADTFTRWENDPALIHLSRPNRTQQDLEHRQVVTPEDLLQRLHQQHMYLMYLDTQLVGEMGYHVDPPHLLKKERGTAWLGITIGEAHARGQGLGRHALRYLEQQIREHGLARIELGVFEFNSRALRLYQNMGYQEIGRIPDFTYWQDRMWQDVRMEKYLSRE